MLQTSELPTTARLTHALARWARIALWLVACAWLLFALSWGALHVLIVPRVDEWRPALERMATRTLGLSVSIGAISAVSSGPVPSVQLTDVVLQDASGREALRLPQVQGALSVRSLWRMGFDQLVIVGPVLDVRRSADGRWLLAGMELDRSDQDGPSAFLDWLFNQPEVALRGATLRWIDEQSPHLSPLELKSVDFVARNPGRQHLMRLDATPPAHWGQPFSMQAQLQRPIWQTRAGQWRKWNGAVYASLPAVDARAMGAYVDWQSVLGLDVQAGLGAARVWLDIERGGIAQITSDIALAELSLQWPGAAGDFALRDVRSRLQVQHSGRSTLVATRGLAFVTAAGTPWPGGDVRYQQTLDAAGALAALDVAGEQLDAQALRQMVQYLPLPQSIGDWLRATQASGRAETFRLQWTAASANEAAQWSASGRLRQVSLLAATAPAPVRRPNGRLYHPAARPGVMGADVDFSMNRSGGRATLSMQQGRLVFPGVFEDPELEFDQLQTDVSWSIQGQDIRVEAPRLLLANADLAAEVALKWRTADPASSSAKSRFPGILELDATIQRAHAAQIVRYLPLNMNVYARNYLRQAIVAGQVSEGRVRIAGDLWDFPFGTPGSGRFDVRAQMHQVALNYVPRHLLPPESLGWPGAQVGQARLTIEQTRLRIDEVQAVAQDWPALRIVGARAEIPNFYSYTPELVVHGQIRGPVPDALAFVQRSALTRMTDGVFEHASGAGNAELDLQLRLPLQDSDASTVQGQLRLAGADLRISPEAPWLHKLHGTLAFTESGFDLPVASAQLLGGPVRFSGRMTGEPGARVVFQGEGQVSAEGLAQAEPWPWLAPLRHVASGQAPYQARLEFGARGTTHLQVDSTLQGMTLALPAPFDKAATASLPLRLVLQPLESGTGAHQRNELLLELGTGPKPLLSLLYQLEHVQGATRALAGSLGIQAERPALPAQGVRAQVRLDLLDAQAWRHAGQRLQGAAGLAGLGDAEHTTFWPNEFGLIIQRVEQDGRVFRNVVAGGTRERDIWRLSVDADELSGYLEYRPQTAQAPAQMYGRLARLDLSPTGVEEVENLLQQQPQAIPAMDLVVERLRVAGRDLGRLEMQAVNRQTALAAQDRVREWRLNTFQLTTPEARLQASGNWVASRPDAAAVRRTALRVDLDIQDAGLLLERLGMPGLLRGGKGTIEGHLGWIGSPLSFHAPSLGGALTIDVGSGQFLQAEPGVARLLGVLSLQSLPRRLVLDFRDVFSEGFAFDFVRGHVAISDGVASTNNLQMKGVNAAVLIEGQADIVRQTQDITAVVVPELNAGTASLVATVINPVTGLGSFLAQFLLRQPLQEAATRQFRVTGPWVDPQVERVARRNIATGESPEQTATTGARTP